MILLHGYKKMFCSQDIQIFCVFDESRNFKISDVITDITAHEKLIVFLGVMKIDFGQTTVKLLSNISN